jgi:hypothetical protein
LSRQHGVAIYAFAAIVRKKLRGLRSQSVDSQVH